MLTNYEEQCRAMTAYVTVHKICKRIGAASYCTLCTVGGAASLTRPLAEEIYTLKDYLTLPKL